MNKNTSISFYGDIPKITTSDEIARIVTESLAIFQIHQYLLEISFVAKEEMRQINLATRAIDHSTDILSFPQIKIPGQKTPFLGNITISFEMVMEKEENFEDVVKHGLLHLIGFDHETDDDAWQSAAQKIGCNL